jgi:uncharacterized protein (TIGR01244 family)
MERKDKFSGDESFAQLCHQESVRLVDTTIRQLEPGYWSAGYISKRDVQKAAELGFSAIVNILPQEDQDQYMTTADAEASIEQSGLDYRYMPLYGHQVNNEYIARAFGTLIDELEGPTLVYCRSGTRVTLLWGMIRAGELTINEILDKALDNGYDIHVIKEDMEMMARKIKSKRPAKQDS